MHWKKIIVLGVVFNLFILSLFSIKLSYTIQASGPQLVQVSDNTASDFYDRMTLNNGAKDAGLVFGEMSDKLLVGKDYDAYFITAKRSNVAGNHMAVVTCFTNKAGYVSKITITAPLNNDDSIIDAYVTEYVILGALGIEDTKDKAFMSDIAHMKPPFEMAIWDNWANRNLVISHGPSPTTDSLFYIRITAYDKVFN